MRGIMRHHHAMGVVIIAAVLGVTGCGLTWMQTRETYAPGTIPLGVAPGGIAVDARTGRVFIANAGIDGSERTVSVLDSRTGRLIQTVSVGQGPQSVAVNERTGRLFVANAGSYDGSGFHNGSIAVLDTRNDRMLRRMPIPGNPSLVTIDALTGRALVTAYNSPAPGATIVYELDGSSGRLVRATTRYRTLLASDRKTGRTFVAKGKDIVMRDDRNGGMARTILRGADPLSEPGSAVVDERTGRLFVADYTRGRVSVIDTRSGALLSTAIVGSHPLRLSVDPQTARVFVVNQGSTSPADRPTGAGSVTMLDARTGAVLRTVILDIDAVAMALDERRGLVLVTTSGPTTLPENGPSRKGKLFVLDARSGAIRRVLPVGAGPYAIAEDTRAGQAFVVNTFGNGGSYNGPSEWYLRWLPYHPPKGTASIINVTR